ncbi:MAG TPA: hypothetical protein VGS23_06595, partial [Thermoplasmata archaeon]|nr:hypothetical protein [Thermoplasmata archaeon]
AGATWTVTVGSVTHSSSTQLVTFSEPNGTYAWSITPIAGFNTTWKGSTTVQGADASIPVAFAQVVYPVTFTESGLPSGSRWTVDLGSSSSSSTSTQVQFSEPNGSYPWSITPIPGYSTPSWSGNVNVAGSGHTVVAAFTRLVYALTFEETGLPAGTGWTVTVGGSALSSTTGQIVFTEPNGTYAWSVTPIAGYSVVGNGSVGISGASVNVAVPFSTVLYPVAVVETGLPSGTNWTVQMGSAMRSSTTPLLVFEEANGTYSWSVLPIAGYVTTWKGSLSVDGSAASLTASFTRFTYAVNFTETGLPKGTAWTVTMDGLSESSSSSGLSIREPNGTYAWSITPISGYTTVWKGSASVAASGVPVAVPFAPFTYVVSFNESGLPGDVAWSVTVGNVTRSGTGMISVPGIVNGSYVFAVGPVPGYNPGVLTGSVVVQGGAAPQQIPFSAVTPAPTFLGLPQVEGYAVLGAILVVAAIAVAAALLRRGRPRTPPAEEGAYQDPGSYAPGTASDPSVGEAPQDEP